MADAPFAPALAHGPLNEVVEGLWAVEGALPNMALNRFMIVWRAPGGGLVLHSPIRMDDAGMAALEALGRPRWLLVPNEGHRLDVRWFKDRYPEAVVVAPANARAKVEEVVAVERACEDAAADLGVRVHRPDGMRDGYELVYELDLTGGGRALVVNDVLSYPKRVPGLGGLVLRALGPAGLRLGIPRIVRFFFGKDMVAFRGFVARLAETPDLRVVTFSHGQLLTEGCADALREAAARIR
ncbi:MAG TPA: hypothetical protein PKA64_14780 [Myxococcota bacterium]|nr:hypothetical protein [Myxococcota bacterium]